jgi:hypothetical protein
MSTIIRCSCGKKVRIQDKYLGHRVRCPACGAVHVAEPADAAPVAAAAAPSAAEEIDINEILDEPAPRGAAAQEWDDQVENEVEDTPTEDELSFKESQPQRTDDEPTELEWDMNKYEAAVTAKAPPAPPVADDDLAEAIEEEEAPRPRRKQPPPPKHDDDDDDDDEVEEIEEVDDEPVEAPAATGPLVWYNNELSKQNLIVLAGQALYIGSKPEKQLPEFQKGLEEGTEIAELMGDKSTELSFDNLSRLRYKHSEISPNSNLDISYDEEGKEKKLSLTFADPTLRDQCVQELSKRLDWDAEEVPESLALVWLRYIAILIVVAVGTGFLAWAYESGKITRAPALFVLIISFAGVWGILGLGGLIALIVGIAGIRELLRPPLTMTYEPD